MLKFNFKLEGFLCLHTREKPMGYKDTKFPKDKYLKTGQIAKLAGFLPSTIRYYTKIGLIKAAGYTQGKYHLYEKEKTLFNVRRIKELIEKRYRLNEIKSILRNESGQGE